MPARAESPCDTEWVDGRALIIALGQRKDDGKPLTPFRPSDPMYPYELPGGRFLFTDEGNVITAVGRFEDEKEAEAALKRVEVERPSTRAFITVLGPYLVPESPTCKVSMLARGKNPTIDAASWLAEKEGVLLAGSQTQCKRKNFITSVKARNWTKAAVDCRTPPQNREDRRNEWRKDLFLYAARVDWVRPGA